MTIVLNWSATTRSSHTFDSGKALLVFAGIDQDYIDQHGVLDSVGEQEAIDFLYQMAESDYDDAIGERLGEDDNSVQGIEVDLDNMEATIVDGDPS
jgi:hypothetical protein